MGAFMINDRLFDNLEIVDSYKKLKLKARKRTVGFSLTGILLNVILGILLEISRTMMKLI